MRLIQLKHGTGRAVAMVEDGGPLKVLGGAGSMRELAQRAIAAEVSLDAAAAALPVVARRDYSEALAEGAVLPPLDHPDPAHCIITGTGLTHLGSASARDEMHKKAAAGDGSETDSKKMFNLGLKGGRPTGGGPGVQPEWFYKGDGSLADGARRPICRAPTSRSMAARSRRSPDSTSSRRMAARCGWVSRSAMNSPTM